MVRSLADRTFQLRYLTPFMEEEKKAAILAAGGDPNQPTYAGTVLLATVKGYVGSNSELYRIFI